MPDRLALAGIIFVLRTGIQWRNVPMEMGCSDKPRWRRLVEWHHAGVWAALHGVLLERLRGTDRLDWHRASLDSALPNFNTSDLQVADIACKNREIRDAWHHAGD